MAAANGTRVQYAVGALAAFILIPGTLSGSALAAAVLFGYLGVPSGYWIPVGMLGGIAVLAGVTILARRYDQL